jgi:hypothetical protein
MKQFLPKGALVLFLLAALFIAAGYWGNALAVFLLLVVCCTVAWYFSWAAFERSRNEALAAPATTPDVVKKEWNVKARMAYRIWSLGLLTVIYIGAIVTLGFFLMPREKSPYFLNADYHSIYNSGVSFRDKLTLYTASSQYGDPGIWACENGSLAAVAGNGNTIELQGTSFPLPVFEQMRVAGSDDTVYTPVNIPYDAAIERGFTISDGEASLHLSLQETDSAGFLTGLLHGPQKRTLIQGSFQSSNAADLRVFGVGAPFKDHFTLYLKTHLTNGLSLPDLLLHGDSWASGYAETRQLIEHWLSSMGNCYILAHHRTGASKRLVFFPSAIFLAGGYSLTGSDGQAIPYHPAMRHTVAQGARLYCGFANASSAFTFGTDTATGNHLLTFRRPHYFSLRPKGTQRPPAGTEYIRSLYNHYSGFANNPLDEGYLFHEEVRKAATNDVSGHLGITADRPGVALAAKVFDARLDSSAVQPGDNAFSLRSGIDGISWQYRIRDFSQHRLAYGVLFGLLTGLYLLIALVLLFFPSPSLIRIEPLIYYVLYALVFTRCLLLWRIATFPPAEDASPREIENYISFDFKNGLGALPNTGLYLLIFFAGLIICRILAKRKPEAYKSNTKFPWLACMTSTPNGIVLLQLIILAGCFLLSILGPRLGAEIITRISTILIPVASYLMLCRRLLVVTPGRPSFHGGGMPHWLEYPARWIYYFYDSRELLLSLITLLFLLVVDRGFAVLFLLFLLFKNIAVSFARRPYTTADTRFTDLLWKPHNYWIFGFLSLALYLLAISWRGMFHQLLQHRRLVGAAFLVLAALVVYVVLHERKRLRNRLLIVLGIILLAIALPFTWRLMDRYIREDVKYVSHRASLIYMPVDSVISESSYNSFEERKILETAEAQWFVNSYLNKSYDPRQRVNLRPYFDAGVNYATQTRDIVLPRFVIAELGNAVMVLLLLLLAAPLLFYFLSYRLYTQAAPKQLAPQSYSAMLSIVLLFTIGLFVWLTSTNRFVFFGQDFPFLSLTSRLSVILPLLLFFFLLLGKPPLAVLSGSSLRKRGILWGIFLGILMLFIVVTGRPNLLNERDFTVRMAETENLINNQVNDLLQYLQDTPEREGVSGTRPNIFAILRRMKETKDFVALSDGASPYSRSILKLLTETPSRAFQPESPVYLRYDDEDERYTVSYNRNVYLELPAYEEGQQWTGNVYEYASAAQAGGAVTLNNTTYTPGTLPYVAGGGPVKVALLPASWLYRRNAPLALINIENNASEKGAVLSMYPRGESRATVQEVRGFVQELEAGALAYVVQGGKPWQVRYEPASGKLFAGNHYINGRQRLIYPMADRNFWIYQYARAAASAYATDSTRHLNAPVTLDYNLTDTVSRLISRAYPESAKKNLRPNFRFAVIAADGDGNIRLMADVARNRKPLDPNSRGAIARLEQEHFFRSSTRMERDQWGNINLLHLAKGPGSSIKPVVAAAVASMVNAGWGELQLQSPGRLEPSPKGNAELRQYGGFNLQSKPWKESHGGDFAGADFLTYIRRSNNIYHSLILFLGSYPKSSFGKDGHYSLANVLSTDADGGRNAGPVVGFRGAGLLLRPYSKGGWPLTSYDEGAVKTYFGNKESVLGNGLSTNFGLYVDDDNKADRTIYARSLVSYGDARIFDTLSQRGIASFLWSFPEESSFIQQLRAFADPMRNFMDGLRNPTLGGRPYDITPLKMAELYARLASQNAALKLHIAPVDATVRPWLLDSTWTAASYQGFLQQYIYKGMEQVLGAGGTGAKLFGGQSRITYAGGTLYGYAKTGTIGSEGKVNANSRRFALILSNKDLATAPAGTARIYSIYFTADQIGGDHNWVLYREIINAILTSPTFKNYMQLPL